ncbi:hypothetical protein N7510_008970 [Penicillium lagena]|uniref:uncharacterized protein n=1 Tax=Penicillium lagena TaxID=94218 RepID=UPI0025412217|nr:uncharacterized protein N7510_008970 [Penicillium lagena]KAJ5606189.1 hypothetical protein N7510_008970 [Penicillium lagena]
MSYGGSGHQCTQALSAKDTLTLSSSGVVIASALSTSVTVYADGIPILWEKSDLPKANSATATATSSTTSATSSTTSATSSTTSRSSTSLSLSSGEISSHKSGSSSGGSNGGGLSEGAKIGIGIGIPVAVIVIGAAIFFFFLRKKRSENTSPHRRPLVSELPPSEPSELTSEGRAPLPEMA